MSEDLFNNTSNDYINPDLPSCPGDSDTAIFEFLPGQQMGVTQGSTTLMAMDFSDFSQDVTGWIQQKRLLESGEVTFIPGLTKGISTETEIFSFTEDFSTGESAMLYMNADISIGFYTNFKYATYDVSVNSDASLGTSVVNAINLQLSTIGANVSVSYDDVSTFTFSGGDEGYQFDVTAMTITNDSSISEDLSKNTSTSVPAFKYPNTAMLGYMLKMNYPVSITDESTKYVNINHVPDRLTVTDPSGNTYFDKAVDVGMNGESSDSYMSAGDYLSYIDTNSKWEKTGIFRSWITAEDPEDSVTENLITGLYVFNPQTYPVQIEYIVIL